jgi:hypothetical protein
VLVLGAGSCGWPARCEKCDDVFEATSPTTNLWPIAPILPKAGAQVGSIDHQDLSSLGWQCRTPRGSTGRT